MHFAIFPNGYYPHMSIGCIEMEWERMDKFHVTTLGTLATLDGRTEVPP